MSWNKSKYQTPVITLLIIGLNFLFFFGSFIGPDIPHDSTKDCLELRHPECLRPATSEEMWQCGLSAIQGGKDPFQCTADNLKRECLIDFSSVDECFSPITRTVRKYGAMPAATGIDKYWRLISSTFVHAGWLHIVTNMLILFLAGIFLEVRLGKIRYLTLYLLSGIGADLLYFLMNADSVVPAVGASGAVFGVFGASMVMKYFDPKQHTIPKIGNHVFYEFLPRGYFTLMLISAIIGVLFATDTSIGHTAHLGGFIAGFILVLLLRKKDEAYDPKPNS